MREERMAGYSRWGRANAEAVIRTAGTTDGYESSNLSVLSQRLFRNNPIISFAYAQFPEGTVECVLSDGTVASLVYMKEHDVCAWSLHRLGGGWKAVCVAANGATVDGTSDVAFLARRTATATTGEGEEASSTSRVEWAVLSLRDIDPDDRTLLANLRMDAVRVVSGETAPAVASGETAVRVGASKWAVGCPFTSTLRTTSPEFTDAETAQMEVKNATEAEVRVIDGCGFTVRAAAFSSVGYMATASVGMGAGFALNTLAQFQQIRDDLLRDGYDPDAALAAQAVSAVAWSLVEKAQFSTALGRPLTGLQKKVLAARIARAAFGKGKASLIGKAVRAGSWELAATTVAESVEEGVQGGIEGFTSSALRDKGFVQSLADGMTQAAGDFVESLGSMALIGGVGMGVKTTRSNRDAASYESLVDFASKRVRAVNAMQGRLADAAELAPKPEEAKRALAEVRATLARHGGDIASALDELRDRHGLNENALRDIGDYLDLQSALQGVARSYAGTDAATAEFLADFADGFEGGRFAVGAPGSRLDAQRLYDVLLPGTKVEEVEIPDMNAPEPAPVAAEPTAEQTAAQEAVAAAEAKVATATVGSARRGAERELRKARRRLERANAAAPAPQPGKRPTVKAERVTLPSGESYVLVRDDTAPNIHSLAYGQSVAQAMQGAEERTDGRTLFLDGFKAMDAGEKMAVAVTPEQYMAMTDAERENYVNANQLYEGGRLRVLDDKGREVLGSDAVVSIKRGYRRFTRTGGNWELAHEHGHFIAQVVAKGMTEEQVATMRRLFGDPTSADERWNEENANDQFAEWLRGKYDFRASTRAERRAKMNWFQRALDTVKHIFALSGERPPVAPVERTMREQAAEAAFNALRNGDFSGLDQFAGIEFGEDKAKPTDAAEGATEAKPTAEARKPAEAAQTQAKTTAAAPKPTQTARKPAAKPSKPRADGASQGTQDASAAFQAGFDAAMAQIAADPGRFSAQQPLRTGGKMTVLTPDYSMSVEVEPMWVPLAALVESTDDRAVQMRDRTRMATDQQVAANTRKGVFYPLALFPGTVSDRGSPIVGGGNRIISGHGRKRMLDALAAEGRFGEYLDATVAEARRRGLPPPPDGMENPVLVQRVTGGLETREDLVKFAELSNRSNMLERSGAEFAETAENPSETGAASDGALDAAERVLAPPEPETFVPVPAERGTATLPGPGAEGKNAYQVNADGNPATAVRTLPPGAWNLLRDPYDVRRPPAPSAQDRAGRGLGISAPPPATDSQGRLWNGIFPHFQGNKAEMADRTTQAIRRTMTKAERGHYRTVVDYFGGGGRWGLYHALTNFENARELVVNEFDGDRLEKIRLLHEIDGQVADEAAAIILDGPTFARIRAIVDDSSSPSTIAGAVERVLLEGADEAAAANSLFDFGDTVRRVADPRKRAVLRAFCDCARQMLATAKDADGKPVKDAALGVRKALDALREDGKNAKAAADAFKARGGRISYRAGDAATFDDAPSVHEVVAVCDPPYYLTQDYQQGVILGLDLVPDNWSYEATRRLLRGLVDKGDAIVYTDEAWWNKDGYAPDQREYNGRSTFGREQEALLDIINTLDHFDVAGRVAGRQETLGIQHGHEQRQLGAEADADEQGAEGGEDRALLRPEGAADQGGGDRRARHSVRRVAGVAEAEDRPARRARPDRGRAGDRALAGEVVVSAVADALASASPETDPARAAAVARHSVRQVREERMADYARTVSRSAKRWLAAAQKRLDAHMAAHGYTEKVWHGTAGGDFGEFRFSDASHGVPAAYFTYRRETAQNYAALAAMDDIEDGDYSRVNVRGFYVNPGRVLDYDEARDPTDFDGYRAFLAKAYADGYDAVRCRNVLDDQGARLDERDENMTFLSPEDAPGNGEGDFTTDTLIVFDRPGRPGANRVKAADPVTFMDDADGGLPIPLEMRADQSLPDVRYSVGVRRAMQDIADGRGRGVIHNPEYGDIDFPLGSFGRVTPNGNIRHGLGLLHIVFARMAKEGASLDDAVQTAIEVADAAESGVTTRDEKNRLWLDRNGVRAVVAKNADGKKVITGYEIYADEPKVTNRASFGSDNLPTPRSEDVLSALKSRLASLPEATPHNIPYPAPGAQGGVESGVNRHGERYSVRAVGKYAGELRRLAWGLKLAHHRAMEDAARMMAPLIPDNAVVVPMPNHGGKPVATMLLAYYISGEKDGVDVVPALEAEPHESNYRHKKRVGRSAEIVMHRTGAAIEPNRPVVLIDNVVASGATYRAAQRVLPEADLVTLADATRGRVDFDPSLQDIHKAMAEDEGDLAETLDAASVAPAGETPEQVERVSGNRVERHSVRRGTPMSGEDIATALLAARRLAGKDVPVDEADRLLKNMGVTAVRAPDLVARANALADRNREKMKDAVERSEPSLFAALAREGMMERAREAIDRAIAGGASAADPDVGRMVQRAIESKRTRDLMAAKGFTAARLMAECPIDLPRALLAVAEYERTPEEQARLEAARKKREEERRRREAEDDRTDEERLADVDDPTVTEPTEEEMALFNELMTSARFAEAARKGEEERKKRAAAKRKAAEAKERGEEADGAEGGADGADRPFEGLDAAYVCRVAPVFEDADLFAQFLVQWTMRAVAEKHPELPATAEMWKSPVAIRELKQTATNILRRLAKDALGSPALNHARNFADHAINELERDAECRTFNAVYKCDGLSARCTARYPPHPNHLLLIEPYSSR